MVDEQKAREAEAASMEQQAAIHRTMGILLAATERALASESAVERALEAAALAAGPTAWGTHLEAVRVAAVQQARAWRRVGAAAAELVQVQASRRLDARSCTSLASAMPSVLGALLADGEEGQMDWVWVQVPARAARHRRSPSG